MDKKKRIIESLQGLTQKELNDIIQLNTIYGVSEKDREIQSVKIQKIVYGFVMSKYPWLVDFQYPSERSWEGIPWETPFAPFFSKELEEPLKPNWLDAFLTTIDDQLQFFKHWINYDPKDLKGAAKHNKHLIKRFKLARDIQRKYPTFERDLSNLKKYSESLLNTSLINPLNPLNYPLYASLYSVSNQYGGSEEGGWHYDHWHYHNSIKVNSFKQARVAAVHLLKNYNFYHPIDHVHIILEKEPKVQETKGRPHYA